MYMYMFYMVVARYVTDGVDVPPDRHLGLAHKQLR